MNDFWFDDFRLVTGAVILYWMLAVAIGAVLL